MTSGQWITYYVPFFYLSFIGWELVQLARRRAGNASALTLSQYVVRRAKKSDKWKWIVIAYPLFHIAVGIWLFFHFEAPRFIGEL